MTTYTAIYSDTSDLVCTSASFTKFFKRVKRYCKDFDVSAQIVVSGKVVRTCGK